MNYVDEPESRARVERALSMLIGEPLTDMWRYCGRQRFEFGVQRPFVNRREQEAMRADRSLVVHCAWMLTGPSRFLLCSKHFGPRGGRFDRFAHDFYRRLHERGPVVTSVRLGDLGDLVIRMSDGYALYLAPNRRLLEDPVEWRYLGLEGAEQGFVLHGRRYYWDGEETQFDPSDGDLD